MRNFTLVSKEFIKDYKLDGYFFKHKSGANVCILKNKDKNRFFSASFKTLPENNKGIPHILEHIVLNGSAKYNLKDTFGYLLKSSLWSYLNALTFQDKTIYPVGSFQNCEFEKLFKIYVDSVFKPTLKLESFLQEGICNIIKDNKIVDIDGVVYNEMLSEYSDIYAIIKNENYNRLFNGSYNKYNSAGYPTDILTVTYKDVIDYYKKYYIPENTYLFFYGDINIEYYLNYLNENYLSNYENIKKPRETKADIIINKKYWWCAKNVEKYKTVGRLPHTPQGTRPLTRSKTNTFKILPKYCEYTFYSKNENKRYLTGTFVISDYTDLFIINSFEILMEYLFKYSDFTKTLKKHNFENMLYYNFDREIKKTALTLVMENKSKSITDFEEGILSSLKALLKKGLSKEKLLFLINRLEFKLKEEDFGYKPKGFGYNLLMINSWMNNENPYTPFEREKIIACLKESIEENGFEDLIIKYLIQNKKVIWAEAFSSINNELSFEYKKKKVIKEMGFEILPEETHNYSKINNIPLINVEDIKIVENIYLEEKLHENRIVFYESETGNTFIVKLLFNSNGLTDLELNYLGILKIVLEKNLLNNYNYIGEILFSFKGLEENGFFEVTIKGLVSKKENIFLLVSKILTSLKLEEVGYNIEFEKEKLNNDLIVNSDKYLINRLKSKCSMGFRNREYVLGIDFLNFLEKVEIQNECINNIHSKIFVKDNLEIFITCESNNYANIKKSVAEIILDLATRSNVDIRKKTLLNEKGIENISINSNTASVGMLLEFENKLQFTEIIILKSILENDFLLKYIRNKGFAYGYGVEIFESHIILYSFKDGNYLNTIKVFENIDNYLSSIKFTNKELEMFFISGINEYIKPKHINKQFDIFINEFYESSISKTTIDEKLINENLISNFKFENEKIIISFI